MFNTFMRLRPRLIGSALIGVTVFAFLPGNWARNSRYLVSWDTGIALYLVLTAQLAIVSSTETIRKRARLEDVGAGAIFV